MIESYELISNQYFAIVNQPTSHNQHPNQQKGLDLYITVLNIETGEVCFKKIYENTKGKFFKHTGFPPQYYEKYVDKVRYIPYQVIKI